MKWMTPWAWFLFIPLALLILINYWRREVRRPALQFSSVKLIQNVAPSLRARLQWLPQALKIAALIFAIVAMARPQKANTKVNKNVEGIDIMLCLDVSDSMNIEDMNPNRIEAAKATVRKFIRGRTSDRIGLIIFAGESYTRVPLTLDYDVLLQSLEDVDTENIKQGTAIGVAMANAVARLKDSTARSRILIFLTDGENNSGTIDPYTALDIAKGYGIKIYTIGVGVDGQAQLPVFVKDAFGRKIKQYQPIHSTINEELLQQMASDTGGKFWRAQDNQTLSKVFSSIDTLEKTKIQVNEYVKYTELFPQWLKWGVLLYGLQLLLGMTVLRSVP